MPTSADTSQTLELERLADVDRAIGAIRGAPRSRLSELLGRLGAAVLTYCHAEVETVTTPTDVFGALHAREARRFLALCLVRVAGDRQEVFDDTDIRVASVKLFDDVLANDVYALLKIEIGSPGHEKVDALAAGSRTAVRESSEVIRQLGVSSNYAQARTDVLKTLRSKRIAPFISPFVPRDVSGPQLEELLSLVSDVTESDGDALLRACEVASAACSRYINEAAVVGTEYASDIYARIGELSAELVTRRYAESGVGLPASVALRLSEKKYPLDAGSQFDLVVAAANAGPGVALDMTISVEGTARVRVLTEAIYLGSLAVRDLRLDFALEVLAERDTASGRTLCCAPTGAMPLVSVIRSANLLNSPRSHRVLIGMQRVHWIRTHSNP